MSSPGQRNKSQTRNLGSYLVIKRVETLHWTFKDCYDGQLTEICQFNMVKPYFERFRFICCFTSRSTARVILRRVVYGWRNQWILVGQDSAL